jgi:putative ABC transport system permease protein
MPNPPAIRDDAWRGIAGIQGVAETGNAAYLTIQMAHAGKDTRVMIVGIEVDRPNRPGAPPYLTAGRPILQGHYEAIADERDRLALGERVTIRRHDYTVVGLTRRMVSSSGDPMIFVPLKDAQEIQFLKDNDALVNERARTAANPAFNRPGVPGLLEAAGRPVPPRRAA